MMLYKSERGGDGEGGRRERERQRETETENKNYQYPLQEVDPLGVLVLPGDEDPSEAGEADDEQVEPPVAYQLNQQFPEYTQYMVDSSDGFSIVVNGEIAVYWWYIYL